MKAFVDATMISRRVSAGDRGAAESPFRPRLVPEISPCVSRPALAHRLAENKATRVVLIATPAGYGKTTLFRDWQAAEQRPVVWLDCGRDDAAVVLRHLATTLDQSAEVLTRVRRELSMDPLPFVLILDNCHELSTTTLDCVASLVGAIPDGSVIALAGRSTPKVPLGRLRLESRVVELGPADLALSRSDVGTMLNRQGVYLSESEVNALHDRAEGWPAGLQLAALGHAAHGHDELEVGDTTRGDEYVAEYIAQEVLASLDPELVSFARAVSILERLSGPLCDYVLERTDSAAQLERLAGTDGLFVTALDAEHVWYRCHRLMAEFFEDELRRGAAELHRSLHWRASQWFEVCGDFTSAVHHAIAADDRERVGALILPFASDCSSESSKPVGVWLGQLDERWIAEVPDLVFASVFHALRAGDSRAAERSLDRAWQLPEAGCLAHGEPSVAVGVAMVTAVAGREQLEVVINETQVVRAAGRAGNAWWALATGLQGACEIALGDVVAGRRSLEEALPALRSAPEACTLALSNLALADVEDRDWTAARERARRSGSRLRVT